MSLTEESTAALLHAADAPNADPVTLLAELGKRRFATREEAERVAKLIRRWLGDGAPESEERIGSTFHDVLGVMQSMPSLAVAAPFVELLPAIVRLYEVRAEQWLCAPRKEGGYDARAGDLVFALKVFAIYGEIRPIADAIARGIARDEYLWSVVARILGQSDDGLKVIECMKGFPEGFVGIALLDLTNQLARDAKIAKHPIDNETGHARLRGWISGDETSYAHSATAALPFVNESARGELLALSDAHADLGIRMEAAWVRAHCGDESGLRQLAAWSADPRHHTRAATYLRELGREDALPAATTTSSFRALAEMAEWLSHPNEFGRAPDRLELFDERTLDWPPTNDRRVVRLVRYCYENARTRTDEGIGMVGSTTFALFGEATADLSAEDVYALHCCWELERNGDPRAPKKRSIDAGRKLLGFTARPS